MTSRETAFAHRRPRRRTFLTWIVFLLFFSSTRMVVMGHTSTVDSTSTLTSTAMQHPWSARDRNGRTITLSRKRVVSTIRGGAGNSRNLSNPFTSASTSTRTPHTPSSSSSSSSTTPLFSNSRFATNNKREDDDQTKAPESTTTTKEMLDAFLTRDSRNSFIARVYAILSVQLIVTAISVVIFGTKPSLSAWMRPRTVNGAVVGSFGTVVPVLSLLLSTACWFTMAMSVNARRRAPLKWQLVSLFTIGEAISVGFLSSFYQFKSVVAAMLATATAATSVSLYTALQKNPKYDLSQWGAGLSSCGLIFVVYGLISIMQMTGVLFPPDFLPYNDMMYGLVGATLFSFYLAYHTKLIVAGKHTKYQMNEQDYVFGAMTLYNDIINLFIYMLRLIGEDRDH